MTAAAPRVQRDRRYSSTSWRRARDETLARDGYRCQACGRQGAKGDRWLVADHRTPPHRYAGPFADLANLWTLCRGCNYSKGDRTIEEWQGRTDPPASSVYGARAIFTSSEAEAARELGSIRGQVEDWRRADKLAWPLVDGPPAHEHPRWTARHTVYRRREAWDVCPPGCPTPVRWPA
jgi:hypothetical protein